MQTWKCVAGFLTLISLAGCAPNSLLKADCHSCTAEDQAWQDFSWTNLQGKWKGSVETWKNERSAKTKVKQEKPAELQFLSADAFVKAQATGACSGLPENALVLNGVFWGTATSTKEFEAFVPAEDDHVAYGRVTFEKMNGKEFCQFHRFGRVMGKNRLNLPSISFTDRALPNGRVIASSPNEKEISVEFLRFDAKTKSASAFRKDGRRPSSKVESERPSLMIRVFQSESRVSKDRGELSSTDEQIYRLWKTN
jgi:hypothetical protein